MVIKRTKNGVVPVLMTGRGPNIFKSKLMKLNEICKKKNLDMYFYKQRA